MIYKGNSLSTTRFLLHTLLTVLGLLGGSGLAFADNQIVTDRQVSNVQDMQNKSIQQGVRVGKLTPKEAKKLRNEQLEIDQLKQEMRANGSLNIEELRTLFERLEKARKNINNLLRNSISSYANLESGES